MNYNDFPKGKTIFVGVDPAAQNTIYSLISLLMQQGWTKEDFLFYTSTDGYVNDQIRPFVQPIDFSREAIEKIFIEHFPELLFLGTSVGNREALWVSTANEKGIKSISFIDHWVNFIHRFLKDGKAFFPSGVWVLNETARLDAEKEGIPPEIIEVHRNPYYRLIEDYRPQLSKEQFYQLLGVEKNKTILFISDPVKDNLPDIGFDEFSTLEAVLQEISTLQKEGRAENYDVLIKLHPRCVEGKYAGIIARYDSEKLKIREVRDMDPKIMNYYADYVIGMFSNMVVEALLMKKNVLRVELNRTQELFKFDEMKCKVVTEGHKLKDELYNFLKND